MKNPYELIWYRKGWSESKTAKNNTRYWEWEIKHNGFNPSHRTKISEMKNTIENKSKFFAQYWGQIVFKENMKDLGLQGISWKN